MGKKNVLRVKIHGDKYTCIFISKSVSNYHKAQVVCTKLAFSFHCHSFYFPFDVFGIVVVLTFKEIRKTGDDGVDANIL